LSLPDVSFTNNLGTVTFKRCLLEIGDSWQWNGRAVVHGKRIGIQGMITRDVAERISGTITDPKTDGRSTGYRGVLTLPWTTLSNIRLESLEQSEGGWQSMAPTSAVFVDDLPSNNIYLFTFFGLPLYKPKLSLPIPAKRTTDTYTQMPFAPQGDVAADNPFYGPIRFRTGYEVMDITLSGKLRVPTGLLPTDIIGTLQQRTGVTVSNNSLADLPEGYPVVFRLGDAIPELMGKLAISSVFVRRAQIQWDVEKLLADITIQMTTQPQPWGEA